MKPEEDMEYRQASELVLTAVALFALLQSATRNPTTTVEQADQLARRAAHLQGRELGSSTGVPAVSGTKVTKSYTLAIDVRPNVSYSTPIDSP